MSRRWVSGLVAGGVAGAALGLLVLPRRTRNSWTRQGRRAWTRGRKIWG
ncbi:hypothetical protein CEB3_c08180 [Peptococcaceae bacterium CEB3]|nr:hypothetical protein CEB3_c08180 [Peptococcaceae bacterium CEB3]